ncbi:IS66 family transposase [Rhizorhapis sp. SPR117]|uniref:IS66 family transposase n=1 Tax=Rhizorhapis sp. SPR117 TaxID=2912611 RepID=UPI001F020725|nr:IS66 family transposase [Rhizorhapis sp. SPR117]
MRFMDIAMALPNDLATAQALIAKLTAEAAERDLYTARIHAERDAAIARAAELEARNAVAAAQAVNDADEIAALKDEVKRISEILAAFQRHRFGKRSEPLDPDQFALALEELETALGLANARLDAAIDARDPSAKAKRRKMLGRLPAHLERVERVIDIDDKSCACCGGELHVIDETVTERLDVVPTVFRALVTRRPRYGCRGCDQAGVIQAPAPGHIVDQGIPTEALLAMIATAKYADHMPIHRQLRIYARQGIHLDPSTVCDWMGRVAWWLKPLHEHLLADLKSSTKLFADETVMPVLAPGQVHRGQLWAYARDDRPWGGHAAPAVAYVYSPDRKNAWPIAHLAGFTGVLQVDGYSGYNKIGGGNAVTLAYCWAHGRRGFVEFQGKEPVADEILRRIAAIYRIDATVRGQSPDERVTVRQREIRPLLNELRDYIQANKRRFSAKSNMTKAFNYILSRWDGLNLFVDDGRVELDSNVVERAIKPQVLTRKNALFAGSAEGAATWAIIGSFMQTCRMGEVDPCAWLTATLQKLAAGHSNKDLEMLMPWNFPKSSS